MSQQDTTLGSDVGTDETLTGVEEHIARDWDIWSRSLGTYVQPVLEDLADTVPSLRAVLLCTADGLNLCTLGVSERDVGRIAALTSSVFGVAAAHRRVISPVAAEEMSVHISTGDDHTVLLGLALPGLGNFVLGAYAEETRLGILLVELRRAAEEIRQRLTVEPS